jgi:nitrogen-specific signal transduction histidine kinase
MSTRRLLIALTNSAGGYWRLCGEVSWDSHPDFHDRRKVDMVIQLTVRLESMAQEMLAFSRSLELQLTRTSRNNVMLEVIEIMQPIAKKSKVELKINLDPSLPSIMMDAKRVRHVPLKLIANPIHAFPP